MSFFNIYSFVLIAVAVIGALTILLARGGFNKLKALALGVVVVAFGAAWWTLRTGEGTTRDAAQAQLVIRQAHQPVLVEFYSDYCVGCMAARPTLDMLEEELKDQLKVIRLDVASGAGEDLGRQLQASATPTFILFDASGNEVWRSVGQLDAEAVRRALSQT
jgi:thioredoxin 1